MFTVVCLCVCVSEYAWLSFSFDSRRSSNQREDQCTEREREEERAKKTDEQSKYTKENSVGEKDRISITISSACLFAYFCVFGQSLEVFFLSLSLFLLCDRFDKQTQQQKKKQNS